MDQRQLIQQIKSLKNELQMAFNADKLVQLYKLIGQLQ